MSESVRKSVIAAAPRNHCSPWTGDEMAFTEKHYDNMTAQAIADALGRSVNGVRRMITLLGLGESQGGFWANDEVAVLHAHYKKGKGIVQVQSMLPHRTRGAIVACASRLGLTGKKSWSPAEKRFLEKHYGTMPTSKIAAALGRSISGVRNVVNILCLAKKQSGVWREEEMAVLRAHYDRGVGIDYVQTLLPGRSRGAIAAQASSMRLTRRRGWSPGEEQILRTFYPVVGMKVADKLPHRTRQAIQGRVQHLGLKVHRQKSRLQRHQKSDTQKSDQKTSTGKRDVSQRTLF